MRFRAFWSASVLVAATLLLRSAISIRAEEPAPATILTNEQRQADGKPYTKLEALHAAQLWILNGRASRGLDEVAPPAATKRLPPISGQLSS